MRHREQGRRRWAFLAGLQKCHLHVSQLVHVEMPAARHPGTHGEKRVPLLISPHADRSQDSKKMGAGRNLHQMTERAYFCSLAAIKGRKLNQHLRSRQLSPRWVAGRSSLSCPTAVNGKEQPRQYLSPASTAATGGTSPWGNLQREVAKCPLALPIASDGTIDGAEGNRPPGTCPSPPSSSQGRRKTTDASRRFAC